MVQPRPDERLSVEDRGWPLLVVRFPPVVSVDTMQSMVKTIEQAYERGERFVAIIDTTAVLKFPAAPARKILTDWVADANRAERDRAFTVGTAVVLPSGPLRALTAAINLVRPPVSPQQWMATLPEAVEWARRRLLDAGVALTGGAEALYAEVRRGPRAQRGA
jgi:hypothetical protein